jgi:HlyD family secretion protein
VTTEKVIKRTIIETVSASGKIQPETEVKISPDVAGEIVELPVKEGADVKKGDLLVKIKPDIYESALQRASAAQSGSQASMANAAAQFEQVKAQFVNAELSFNRSKKLFDQGVIAQADFENAKTTFESAKANMQAAEENVKASMFNVKSAEASVREAKENLLKTTIYAPVDGTISKLSKKKGERVAGTGLMEGSEIMILSNLLGMEVKVDVNENDIIRVHHGDTADIQVDAYLGRKFKGVVTEIASSANNTLQAAADQVTNFTVKVRILPGSYSDLTNPFRPGMSATVDIRTKRVSDVLSVPIQAVTTRSDSAMKSAEVNEFKEEDESQKTTVVHEHEKKKEIKDIKIEECVFVLIDGKAKLRKVKTGIQNTEYFEVKEGLKDGEEVISGPYTAVSRLLRDNMRVNRASEPEKHAAKK